MFSGKQILEKLHARPCPAWRVAVPRLDAGLKSHEQLFRIDSCFQCCSKLIEIVEAKTWTYFVLRRWAHVS